MTFTNESQIVRNYILLVEQNVMAVDDVPNLFNLKEVVENVINSKNNMDGDNNDI